MVYKPDAPEPGGWKEEEGGGTEGHIGALGRDPVTRRHSLGAPEVGEQANIWGYVDPRFSSSISVSHRDFTKFINEIGDKLMNYKG